MVISLIFQRFLNDKIMIIIGLLVHIKIRVKPSDWLTIANLKYHGNLTVENRLLHYTYAHTLIPCFGSLKNKLCKAKDLMPPPYCILVTKMLEHYRIDDVDEDEMRLGLYNKFKVHILTRMNIKYINGG
ncbi:hypothetical protein CR513_58527, partial [Mucuna pruriens]